MTVFLEMGATVAPKATTHAPPKYHWCIASVAMVHPDFVWDHCCLVIIWTIYLLDTYLAFHILLNHL
jgi:hypothetical protein